MVIKNLNWVSTIFMGSYHLFLLIAVPAYLYTKGLPSLGLTLWSLAFFFATGFSITMGYHRLYSHKSYRLHKVIEPIILFFGAMGIQNTAIQWSHNHRLHHTYVDTEKDPYNINQGFWYAHFLWFLEKDNPPFDKRIVADLYKNKLVVLQDTYYFPLLVASNVGAFLLVGWLVQDFIGAFIFTWWLRLFFSHHFTFFINSAAHTWGASTYSKEQTASDNFIMALFTFGEGYHNYHHVFPADYRNGMGWFHYDPSKWMIWSLHKLGLAWNPNKVNNLLVRKKLVMEDKFLLLEKIKKSVDGKAFEEKVHEISERFAVNVAKMNALIREYKQIKKDKIKAKQLKVQKKLLKKEIRHDWKTWVYLSNAVMRA